MASIRARVRNGRYVVTVHGRLLAESLGRLERVCGPALEHREVPLEVRLAGVSATDEAARVFLSLLARRGALIAWGDREQA